MDLDTLQGEADVAMVLETYADDMARAAMTPSVAFTVADIIYVQARITDPLNPTGFFVQVLFR